MSEGPLLEVKGLRTEFRSAGSVFAAVDGVSFTLEAGETLGIVGESGCGKSVTSLSIMRLVPNPPGRIAAGEVRLQGRNLLELSEVEMRAVRGGAISMIFQEPMTSLNPVQTVGDQIIEGIRLHRSVGAAEARARALEMLKLVRIPSPETRIDEYPHQLSGGMRQRVMIAMALACDPQILIADERLIAIEGVVPNPYALPQGCRFHPRCPLADAQCRAAQPSLLEIETGHHTACWKAPLDVALAAAS